MKKIGLLIDSLGTGGAQRQIVNLAIGIKKEEFIPIIFIYNNINFFQEILNREQIVVYYLRRKCFFDLFFLFRLVRILKAESITKLVAFLFMPSGYALISKLFLPRLKVVVSERSFEGKTTLKDKIFPRKLYFLADFITVNSKAQTNSLVNLFPDFKNKIVCIPNGVYDQEYIYQNFSNEFIISSVGRVSALKETKILIKVLSKLKILFPNVSFKVYWVGATFDSTEMDSSYYLDCCEMIFKENLIPFWVWTGQVTNVKEYLSKTNLLVHMSNGEGFPNAICEAMSYGIPVVASNVYDHPFIIEDRINGYLVDSKDEVGLVNAISYFVNLSLEERLNMSKSSFDTAVRSFSFSKMTIAYLDLLKNE